MLMIIMATTSMTMARSKWVGCRIDDRRTLEIPAYSYGVSCSLASFVAISGTNFAF